MNLLSFIEQQTPKVNDAMHALVHASPMPEQLKESILYSIDAGGKRVRPLLVLAVIQDRVGQLTSDHYKIAAAIELIHTYSLIHDDLPAMDNDDFRRGKPTNHKVFGDALAILAGDAMQALAFLSITTAEQVNAEEKVRLIQRLAEASGASGMVGGQVYDLAGEQQQLTLEQLEQIHRLKTGALLTFSIEAGAILAQVSEKELQQFKTFAEHIGLAFQIKDDILDITATTEQLGKPANSDTDAEKSTYPQLLGLEGAKNQLESHYEQAIQAISFLPSDALLAQFAKYIIEREL